MLNAIPTYRASRWGEFGLLLLAIAMLLARLAPARAFDADPFAAIEARLHGRLGVTVVDTGTGQRWRHRGRERFAMCSTFKLLLVAQMLHRVDEGQERLDRVIPYGPSDLLSYSPITRKHVDDNGMSVGDLCAAATRYSDNTAANLLLSAQGGPQGLTRFARSIGDEVTRLDRIEPALNTPRPGEQLDTTSPDAMVDDIRKLVLESYLSHSSRAGLEQWLLGNTTGASRLKAGLAPGWRIADKTGTGDNGSTNDIGVLFPPHGAPIVVAAYISDSAAPYEEREAALAEVARWVVSTHH